MRNIDRFKTPEPVADVPALHHVIHGGPAITDPCCVWSAAYNLLVKRACKDHLPAFVVCDGSSAPTAWLCARFYGHHAVLTPFHFGSSSGVIAGARSQIAKLAFLPLFEEVQRKPEGIRLSVQCLAFVLFLVHTILYCRMDEYGLDCVTQCITM